MELFTALSDKGAKPGLSHLQGKTLRVFNTVLLTIIFGNMSEFVIGPRKHKNYSSPNIISATNRVANHAANTVR